MVFAYQVAFPVVDFDENIVHGVGNGLAGQSGFRLEALLLGRACLLLRLPWHIKFRRGFYYVTGKPGTHSTQVVIEVNIVVKGQLK